MMASLLAGPSQVPAAGGVPASRCPKCGGTALWSSGSGCPARCRECDPVPADVPVAYWQARRIEGRLRLAHDWEAHAVDAPPEPEPEPECGPFEAGSAAAGWFRPPAPAPAPGPARPADVKPARRTRRRRKPAPDDPAAPTLLPDA